MAPTYPGDVRRTTPFLADPTGVANTYFWIDANQNLIALAWTQFQLVGRTPMDTKLREIVLKR